MFKYFGLKLFYFIILFIIAIFVIFTLKLLFIPLLISLFIAMILRPIITYFETNGFSQANIIITIFSTLFIIITTISIIFIPIIIEQIKEFTLNLPQYMDTLTNYTNSIQQKLSSQITFIDIDKLVQNTHNTFSTKLNEISGSLSSYISNIMNLLTYTMLVPFFTFFILKDGHLLSKTLLEYVPNRYFEIFALLFYKVNNSIQLYIRGQIIDASFVGVMTAIGLSIIGFPYAALVGLIAGIGNLVPYFGPILGAIPAIFIIMVTPEYSSTTAIISVISVFAIVQVIETIFVYPIAVGKSVNIHPLIIIFALLVGGELAGILGMIVIIPLVAIVKVTFELLHKYLNEYKIIK